MTASKPSKHRIEHWTTVAVTALPIGWRNVWRDTDTTELIIEACAAVLLQETRAYTLRIDHPNSDGTYRPEFRDGTLDPPYETRAVFAQHTEFAGYLDPVEVDLSIGYLGVVAPDEDPAVRFPASDKETAE
jgi:hypothetical protein